MHDYEPNMLSNLLDIDNIVTDSSSNYKTWDIVFVFCVRAALSGDCIFPVIILNTNSEP